MISRTCGNPETNRYKTEISIVANLDIYLLISEY